MSVTLPASILPTVTTTGSTLPTAVPSFAWSSHPSIVDTCTPATLNWEYSGPQEALQFVLVSNASPHTNVAISRKRAGQSTVIATNIDSTALLWTWPKVNVTAGQYVVEAIGTDLTVVSSMLSIVDGADTSCLADVASTSIPSTTTSSSEPTVTPLQTPSGQRIANIGIIAGGIVAGVVVLIVAGLLGHRVWARRHRQHLIRSRYPSEAAHGDLPSPDVASGAEAPSLTEKGTRGTDPTDDTATTSPLAPNRRPPSSLLSEPYIPATPYISHTQTHEQAAGSNMDVSTIGSRSSAALSNATSTAGLMRTISSCPPSYLTSPSPPPSYVTHATRGATTPRSPHWSYASSS